MQLWREHPFGGDSKAQSGNYTFPNSLSGADMDPTCQRHRALCWLFGSSMSAHLASVHKRQPGTTRGRLGLVARRWPRNTQVSLKQVADNGRSSPDRRQVAQRGHSQRHIDPRTDQIHVTVLQQNVDIERGMLRRKTWRVGRTCRRANVTGAERRAIVLARSRHRPARRASACSASSMVRLARS